MTSPPNRLAYAIAALALAGFLAGCSGYFDNNDTVSRSAGDASDANAAIHTIDPWPLASSETEILSDGNAISATTSSSAAPISGDAAATETSAAATKSAYGSAAPSSSGSAAGGQGGSN